MEISKGQRVHVEYDGTVTLVGAEASASIKDGDGLIHAYRVGGSVSITAADPENWPPQVGDIWKAGLYEWFFRKSMLAGEPPVAVREDGDEQFASHVKALNPVLVRRRGQ